MRVAKKNNRFGQIGEACGISPGAVTLALQDSPRISAETKERVYLAARHAGYRESKVRREHDLCLLLLHGSGGCEPSFYHPINLALWYGVTQAVGAFDGTVHAFETALGDGEWSFATLPTLMRRDKVDGIILTGNAGGQFLAFLREVGLPVVWAGSGEAAAPVDQLYFDYRRGARQAVGALVEAGRRRVAFIAPESGSPTNERLFQGYREALEPRGLLAEELVYHSTQELDALWAKRPEVVFATSRDAAIQVALSATLAGIPTQEGPALLVSTLHPRVDLRYPVSRIVPDAVGLGQALVARLLERRAHPAAPPVTSLLACTLELAT